MSLCPSLRVSVCRALSRKHPLNSSTLYPSLRWWCIVLSWCVLHKNWDAIFKVKVTIRAYMITMWLFQLYQYYYIFGPPPPFFPFFFFSFFFFFLQKNFVGGPTKPKHAFKMCCSCVVCFWTIKEGTAHHSWRLLTEFLDLTCVSPHSSWPATVKVTVVIQNSI